MDKLKKTNSEIRNFMDPKQVAARTNFRAKVKQNAEEDLTGADIVSLAASSS